MTESTEPDQEALPEGSAETALPAQQGVSAAQIVAQLRQAILDGEYTYGQRMPAERHLAVHFGASRGTVREALRQLEEFNLVTRRVGSGTFVRYRKLADQSTVAKITSPLELIEVRFAIEPHMTRLAVLNASGQNLERLGEALEQVLAAGEDVEAFSRADEEMHMALAECTRNPLMVWLYRHINEVRGNIQWTAMKAKILTPERIRQYNQQHRELYQTVRSRDMDGAANLIAAHLEKTRQDLLGPTGLHG